MSGRRNYWLVAHVLNKDVFLYPKIIGHYSKKRDAENEMYYIQKAYREGGIYRYELSVVKNKDLAEFLSLCTQLEIPFPRAVEESVSEIIDVGDHDQ